MVWNNLIVGSHALNSVEKAYVNVLNDTYTFVETNPLTSIITNKSILNQYRIKHVLKCFGKKCKASVQKELQQFHDHRFIDLKEPRDLRSIQQRKRLAYLMVINLKNEEVTVKGRVWADVGNGRDWLYKEDISSPTVFTMGLILSCKIDSMKAWMYQLLTVQ